MESIWIYSQIWERKLEGFLLDYEKENARTMVKEVISHVKKEVDLHLPEEKAEDFFFNPVTVIAKVLQEEPVPFILRGEIKFRRGVDILEGEAWKRK